MHAPIYVTRSTDLAEKPSTKDSGSICNQQVQFFKSEKITDLNVIFLLFIQKSIHGCE